MASWPLLLCFTAAAPAPAPQPAHLARAANALHHGVTHCLAQGPQPWLPAALDARPYHRRRLR